MLRGLATTADRALLALSGVLPYYKDRLAVRANCGVMVSRDMAAGIRGSGRIL